MATGLTDRQRKFADAYAMTHRGKASAIAAGFSPKSAASTASRLLRLPEIQAALKRRSTPADVLADEPSRTPLEHMLWVMRDPEARAARRDRMAIAAAPFVHVKAGEVGKKAAKQTAANEASRGRFAPTVAPLALVRPTPDKS